MNRVLAPTVFAAFVALVVVGAQARIEGPKAPPGGGGLTPATANATYLRLDTTNNPLSGRLQVLAGTSALPGIFSTTAPGGFYFDATGVRSAQGFIADQGFVQNNAAGSTDLRGSIVNGGASDGGQLRLNDAAGARTSSGIWTSSVASGGDAHRFDTTTTYVTGDLLDVRNLATTLFKVTVSETISDGEFWGPDGAEIRPAYTFTSDTSNGFYLAGPDSIGVTVNGVQKHTWNILSQVSTVPTYVPVGSAPEPTYSFTGRIDDGIYSSAAGEVSVATGGAQRVEINSGGIGVFGVVGTTGNVDGGAAVRATTYLRSVGAVGIAPGSLPTCTGASSTQGGQIYHVDTGTDSDSCQCLRRAGTYGWRSMTGAGVLVCP